MYAGISVEIIPRSEITSLKDKCTSNFEKYCQIPLDSGVMILYFH